MGYAADQAGLPAGRSLLFRCVCSKRAAAPFPARRPGNIFAGCGAGLRYFSGTSTETVSEYRPFALFI